jgi:hypothetical protein
VNMMSNQPQAGIDDNKDEMEPRSI